MLRGVLALQAGRATRELPPVMKLVARETWLAWRWVGSNAWVLASLMAMAHVNGDATQMYAATSGGSGDANVSPVSYSNSEMGLLQPGGALPKDAANAFGTVLSLCFIFIFGVSTGLWWRAYQRVEEAVQSREMVVVGSPPPASGASSSAIASSSTPSGSLPRLISRTSAVGTVKQYTLKEIMDMTECFKTELGRGGQGVVFRATLPEEPKRDAAVKRLQKGANVLLQQHLEAHHRTQEDILKEFWSELHTISRLHHRNLVALLGYCVEDDDLFLVYEFMAKGSLDQHLHRNYDRDDAGGAPPLALDWRARMRCAVEVAQGLEYLHSHANPSLVHRDIKSGNILFDDDMQAKIADFGLSKPLQPGHDVTVSTRVRGTHGYVDPVYLINGQPCDKNDVYSYGVMLLELITGRRAIQQRISLVAWCKDFIGTDEPVMRHLLPRMVDSRIAAADYSYDQLYDVVKVAQACVEDKQEHRPTMRDVVVSLYNANCKDYSSSDVSMDSTDFFGSNGGSTVNASSVDYPPVYMRTGSALPSYEIRDNTIVVKCVVGNSKIALRCKIWPTPKNFGLNKVEASLNSAFLWKKGLWWYNAKSSRDFLVDDDVKVTAEWHVALRTSRHGLAPNDPRRSQGPFCVEYLALKDEDGKPLIQYFGDRSPLPEPTKERGEYDTSRSGSGSAERRRSINRRRSMIMQRYPSPR